MSSIPPNVAIDAAGNAVAVWNQLDANGRESAFANRYVVGTGWAAAPVLLESNESDNVDFGVEVGMSDAGNALAAWQSQHPSNSPNNNWVSPSPVGSDLWGSPTTLESGTQNPTLPRLAVNASGKAVAVWFQQLVEGSQVFLMASNLR